MKLKIKQFFAKEFLILFSLILLSGFALVGIYLYNYVLKIKVVKLENSLTTRFDEIQSLQNHNGLILRNNSKILEQKWLFNELNELNATSPYQNYSALWKRLESLQKSDSLILKMKTAENSKELLGDLEAVGFKTFEDFDKFIMENSLSESELKIINEDRIRTATMLDSIRVEVIFINGEISRHGNRVIDNMQQLKLVYSFVCLLGVVAYPVRFVHHVIKWSIQTLKESE